jgi:SSS family solute:Na+ symporter
MLASMFGGIDYAVLAAYFALTFVLGFWSARRASRSSKGFFVAEKSLPWWMIGFTMVAASISAEQMLGEVGFGFGHGMVVSNWELGVFPALALMVLVFLPLYLRSGITTIPEYLEKRYGATTRLLFAIYTVFNNACITLVMVLALGVTAIKHFFGIEPRYAAILLIVVTGVYTIYGGMLSVAWTQTLQCVLLLAAGMTIFFIGLGRVPGGWEGLFQRMPDPHLIRTIDDPAVPWPGLILLMLSTNVWYCCTNQFYVQSCLGARDERNGRLGVLLTVFLGPVLTLCFAFPGYIAGDLLSQGLLPDFPTGPDGKPIADETYPRLVSVLLGPGLRGFVVAAVIGAIMSSVAAIVNSTASVFSNDLYHRWIRRDADDRHLILVGRCVGVLALILAYPLTLFAQSYAYIFTYSQNAWCVLAIPIMLVFTFGALWKRATNAAAAATFIFIAPFVAVPFIWGDPDSQYLDLPLWEGRVHLFNFAFVLWLAAGVFMFVVSLLTRPQMGIAAYVWTPGLNRPIAAERERYAWYQRVGFWAVVAGVMYVVIYAVFW